MLNNDILFVRKGEADHGFAHIFMKRQVRKALQKANGYVTLEPDIYFREILRNGS